MKKISRFSLDMDVIAQDPEATHASLLVDGVRTPYKLEGVSLVDQYETESGYLIFTDCDCPYEELTFVTLLDKGFKPLHSKMLGKFVYVFPSRTFAVQRIDIDDGARVVHGSSPEEGRYRVEVADGWTWRGRRPGGKAVWAPT
ncbi:MAG: hypothetical protein HYX44_02400 [Aquabacterium sp.]|nr:hypothetical protein [Aquabacterium sp.]